MARPANTYRGARRNVWRQQDKPRQPWAAFRISGTKRVIKLRKK